MDEFAVARFKSPYGLAFPLRELIYARSWAERRGAVMTILLDQVLDGAEFEELLLIRRAPPPANAVTRLAAVPALTLWRSETEIVAQQSGRVLKRFTGVQLALAHYENTFRAAAPSRLVRVRRWQWRLFGH